MYIKECSGFQGTISHGIDSVENDCLITEEFKENIILGEQKDPSLVGFSKLVNFNVEHFKVGDDQVNFIHNASNSLVCGT